MKNILCTILFFLPITLISPVISPETNKQELFSQKLHEILLATLKNSHLNCSAVVAVEGKILLSQGFGYANRENKIKNTFRTQFLIGSITKLFTATAILKLVEQGKIQETASVATYLPADDSIWSGQIPEWANQVTIRDLLTHSSGLQEYINLPDFDLFYKKLHTTEDLVRFFAHYPLKFKPGTKFEYSGTGYNLLGAIIERVSRINYGQYLFQEFFKPLGMDSSFTPHTNFLSQIKKTHPSLALGYMLEPDHRLIPTGEINLSTAFAEASIISTALDLYKWTKALFEQKILSQTSLNKMFRPYLETDEKDFWMGYAVFIDQSDPNDLIYSHSGRINGYESQWYYQPKHNIAIIILSNEMNGKTYEVARLLLHSMNLSRIC